MSATRISFNARHTERLCSFVLLVTVWAPQSLKSQQDLTRSFGAEKPDYALLTYSQHYLDSNNNAAEYSGTIYLKVASVALNGCRLKFDVLVQDRYDGTEDERKHLKVIKSHIGPKSFTYRYSYQLDLKETPDLQIDSLLARPAQLSRGTGFVCLEDSACRLQWIRLKTSQPKFRETRTLDGLVDFDQSVNAISIPMASRETAIQSAKYLDQLRSTCH